MLVHHAGWQTCRAVLSTQGGIVAIVGKLPAEVLLPER